MISRGKFAVLLMAGCTPAGPQKNEMSPRPAAIAAARYRMPQHCDSPSGYKVGMSLSARGFLQVDRPYLMLSSAIDQRLQQMRPALREATATVYQRSSLLRSEYQAAFEAGDPGRLREIFQESMGLAAAALDKSKPIDLAAENYMIEQLYELSYLIIVIDERYGYLASRDKSILGLQWSREIRGFYDAKSPADVDRYALSGFAVLPNSLRGLIIARLLEKKINVAEELVVFGMYSRVDSDFYPVSHLSIRNHMKSSGSLDGLVFDTAPRLDGKRGCSDLFASYIEWLDLRSRVGRAITDKASARDVKFGLKRLESVPRSLIGPRYQLAITGMARRLHLSLNGA